MGGFLPANASILVELVFIYFLLWHDGEESEPLTAADLHGWKGGFRERLG
ncbi:hypothetical protein J6TS7_54340 [Paenibacillus dendritiformis]|nr:hypothetical protein J6TS7_54340 [Paenibacillus dendritiformis]